MKKEGLLNLSLFIVRLIVGAVFVVHGAQKLFGMFGGMGIEGTIKLVEGLALSNPRICAFVWSGIEFVGGIFLIFGIFARWAASMIVLTIFVLLWKTNFVYSSFFQNIGIEYNLLIIGSCVPIILLGGGSWSVWD